MRRIVPGIHSVGEVFKVRPEAISELWLREGDLGADLEIFLTTARLKNIKVKRVSHKTLEKEVYSHQGVIAFVENAPAWLSRKNLESDAPQLIFALDQMEDPHNLGSIMRLAWNLNAGGLILPTDHAAPLTPSAQKVASGAFEHVPVLEVVNLAAELKVLKDLGFWVYGLAGGGGQSLIETSFAKKVVIVVGGEHAGLRKPVASACDALVSIPENPRSSSFNAAMAAAIAGYECVRQRTKPQNPENSRKKL